MLKRCSSVLLCFRGWTVCVTNYGRALFGGRLPQQSTTTWNCLADRDIIRLIHHCNAVAERQQRGQHSDHFHLDRGGRRTTMKKDEQQQEKAGYRGVLGT